MVGARRTTALGPHGEVVGEVGDHGLGAEVLGWADRIGTLEAGKLADVIVVDGDPLADIARLESVRFVMKEGRIVKDAPR